MTRRRYKRPASPEDVAKRKAKQEALVAEVARLEGQGVEVNRDHSGQLAPGTIRPDFALALFQRRGSVYQAEFDAVRRLEADIAASRNLDKARVATAEVRATPQWHSDPFWRAIDAADRVFFVLAHVGQFRELIQALLEPHFTGHDGFNWRDVVKRVTGISNRDIQGDRVKCACTALARAFNALDYRERKRA